MRLIAAPCRRGLPIESGEAQEGTVIEYHGGTGGLGSAKIGGIRLRQALAECVNVARARVATRFTRHDQAVHAVLVLVRDARPLVTCALLELLETHYGRTDQMSRPPG